MPIKVLARIIPLLLLLISAWGLKLAGAQTQDPVEAIRQHYANINQKVARYRRVKKNLSGFSAEGGELVAYFHGPTVMKMVATFLGESGRAVEEYYFWNGQLIFVLQTDNRYDKPFGKIVRKTENRFYFKDDKMIRWVDEKGEEVPSDSAEYAPKQAEYSKTSKQFVEGAKSKGNTIESPD
jgi:hypothetical protein